MLLKEQEEREIKLLKHNFQTSQFLTPSFHREGSPSPKGLGMAPLILVRLAVDFLTTLCRQSSDRSSDRSSWDQEMPISRRKQAQEASPPSIFLKKLFHPTEALCHSLPPNPTLQPPPQNRAE